MSSFRRATGRMRAFFTGQRLDEELDAELAAHIDLAVDDYIERGMTREEARRCAMVEFGGVQQAREQQREARGLMSLDILLQDLKYTLRTLGRDPGFTTVAVLILALAIGANIAVFSVVNTLMLRPLPFPNAQQLLWIAPPPTKCGLSCATYSTDAYDEFRIGSRSYQDVTGYFAFSSPDNLSLKIGSAPVTATSIDVIANFFQLLGVQPTMGRVFRAEDARNSASPVILLSNAWWKRQFNADPNIMGKAFDINGHQTTVIGVLPASFDFGAVFAPGTKVDAITPLNLYGPPRDWGNIITMIGRLKPGVSLAQAREDADRVAPTMCWNNKRPDSCGSYAEHKGVGGVVPVPLKDYIGGKLRRALVVLWFAVGAILLIACVNLSNLLLARAAARSKEFAMRGALGASRGRIVRQLLTESLVLSGAGAGFGLLLAIVLVLVGWRTKAPSPCHSSARCASMAHRARLDRAHRGISTAVLFGSCPACAWRAVILHESLKDTSAGSGQSRKHERVRSILVVSEVRSRLHASRRRGASAAQLHARARRRSRIPARARRRGQSRLRRLRSGGQNWTISAFTETHRHLSADPIARERHPRRRSRRLRRLSSAQPESCLGPAFPEGRQSSGRHR
jgi:predicted permease